MIHSELIKKSVILTTKIPKLTVAVDQLDSLVINNDNARKKLAAAAAEIHNLYNEWMKLVCDKIFSNLKEESSINESTKHTN